MLAACVLPSEAVCICTEQRPRAGQTALIPLTASLYVEAELDDADKVLVELGTGYYAEVLLLEPLTAHGISRCLTAALKHSAFHVQKSAKDGKEYFGRKVLLVKEQLDKIGQVCHCYWLL